MSRSPGISIDTRGAQKTLGDLLGALDLEKNPPLLRAVDDAVEKAVDAVEAPLERAIEKHTGLSRADARKRLIRNTRAVRARRRRRNPIDTRRWSYRILTRGDARLVHAARIPHELMRTSRGTDTFVIRRGKLAGTRFPRARIRRERRRGKPYPRAYQVPRGDPRGRKWITPPALDIRRVYRAQKPRLVRRFLRVGVVGVLRAIDRRGIRRPRGFRRARV